MSQPVYKPYRASTDDRLWMLRAVAGEGGEHRRVASVLVQRFRFLDETRPGLFPTLERLVRAYSQPVNPRWARGGDLWRKANAKGWPEGSEAAADRRARVSRMTQFGPETRAAVDYALGVLEEGGELEGVPPEAVHFAAPRIDGSSRGLVPLEAARPGRERLWTSRGAQRWAQKKKGARCEV